MNDTTIDMHGKRIGFLTVISRVPNPNAATSGAYWECICERCQCPTNHAGSQLRKWEQQLEDDPTAFVACAACAKRNRRNRYTVAQMKSPKKHFAPTFNDSGYRSVRKPIPVCSECCNLNSRRHWHRPCPGRMSHTGEVCGARAVGEPQIRAVATIGSPAAQCLGAVAC